MSVATVLQELMDARGLDPAQVEYKTEQLGNRIDKATVYRIKNGSRTPTLGTLVTLCKVLHIEPAEFLERAGLSQSRKFQIPLQLEEELQAIPRMPDDSQEYLTSLITYMIRHEQEALGMRERKRNLYNVLAARWVTTEEKQIVRDQDGDEFVRQHLEDHINDDYD